jgi:hypothetical protein
MALTYAQQGARSASSDFRAIVDAIVARQIPNVMTEAANTPGHDKRIALALALVRPGGLGAYGEVFYRLMAGHWQSVAADDMWSLSDADWSGIFGAVYPTIAGVTVEDSA